MHPVVGRRRFGEFGSFSEFKQMSHIVQNTQIRSRAENVGMENFHSLNNSRDLAQTFQSEPMHR